MKFKLRLLLSLLPLASPFADNTETPLRRSATNCTFFLSQITSTRRFRSNSWLDATRQIWEWMIRFDPLFAVHATPNICSIISFRAKWSERSSWHRYLASFEFVHSHLSLRNIFQMTSTGLTHVVWGCKGYSSSMRAACESCLISSYDCDIVCAGRLWEVSAHTFAIFVRAVDWLGAIIRTK